MIAEEEVRHKIRNMEGILLITSSGFKIEHIRFFEKYPNIDEYSRKFSSEILRKYWYMNKALVRLDHLKEEILSEIIKYLQRNPYLLPGNLPKDQWTPWQHEIYRRDPLVQFHAESNNFSTTLDVYEIQDIINQYGE